MPKKYYAQILIEVELPYDCSPEIGTEEMVNVIKEWHRKPKILSSNIVCYPPDEDFLNQHFATDEEIDNSFDAYR